MVLLSGRHLEATGVAAILRASGGAHAGRQRRIIFPVVEMGRGAESGTAVAGLPRRKERPHSELPLAAREQNDSQISGADRQADVVYLIMPDPLRRMAIPPMTSLRKGLARTIARRLARTWRGLAGIREHFGLFEGFGLTTFWLTPIVKNGATEITTDTAR